MCITLVPNGQAVCPILAVLCKQKQCAEHGVLTSLGESDFNY